VVVKRTSLLAASLRTSWHVVSFIVNHVTQDKVEWTVAVLYCCWVSISI